MEEKQSDYMSFYKICLEMFKEDIKDTSTYQFENYYREQKKHFKEIFECLALDIGIIRKKEDDSFEIPESQKETIKSFLRNYKSSTMKKVRKKQLPKLELEELQPLIKEVEELIQARLEGYQKTREISRMYLASRYLVKQAISKVRQDAISQIINDVEGFLPMFSEEMLNDTDKAYLLAYYGEMLQEASNKWREIVDIVSELRSDEIIEMSEKEILLGEPTEKDIDDIRPLALEDINSVLWRAIRIQNKSEIEDKMREPQRPSDEDLKAVKELIDKLTKERKSEEC